MDCPNCGDHARDEYANYCSTCGNRLKPAKNRTSQQTAAGVLIIFASCISGAIGMLLFFPLARYFGRTFTANGSIAVILLFELAAFFFGVLSGILIFKRQYFSVAVVGVSFVMVSGFLYLFIPVVGFMLAAPVLFFAVLALVLTAVSRREFI